MAGGLGKLITKGEENVRKEIELMKVSEHMNKVRFFPGSKSEYESMVGYEVEIIDTKDRDIGVYYISQHSERWYAWEEDQRQKKLVEKGIEAIINCHYSNNEFSVSYAQGRKESKDEIVYGLPVARKK